jgi:peptidoglycan hydrolase CwlO-like protein
MNIPTLQDFKANERTVYAYIIMLAVGALFLMLKGNYDKQLKQCNSERVELTNKIDTLQNKLIKVITKQNELEK